MEQKKGLNLLQKLYRYRLKIDRKGTTIVNLSSLFCIPCLLFAPHMSIAGIVLSLILGYHISLESEGDDTQLEETVRSAAETIRKTAASAASTIRQEVDKNRSGSAASAHEVPVTPVEKQAEPIHENREIVEDLQAHMDSVLHGNPATYHTVYSATAGSVPTLKVPSEDAPADDVSGPKAGYQS